MGRPTTVLTPRLFEVAQTYTDFCEIVDTDFHERIHAITNKAHEEEDVKNGKIDAVEFAGMAAQLVCDDEVYGDHNKTDENRFFEAVHRRLDQEDRQKTPRTTN